MILVDTSVWIDHFRHSDETLAALLDDGQVLSHAFVRGELACGNLSDREATLWLHRLLPDAATVEDDEVLTFIERRHLGGRGLGYIDVHLLSSTLLTPDALIWTRDKRLAQLAGELGVAFHESGAEGSE